MNINITLIGQMITFAILIIFTMKFVWPPLIKVLDERSKKIAAGIAASDKAQAELQDMQLKITHEMQKANEQANQIIQNAQKRATEIIDQAKENAKFESDRVLDEAKLKIDHQVSMLKNNLRSNVSFLIKDGIEKILRIEVDVAKHKQIINEIESQI